MDAQMALDPEIAALLASMPATDFTSADLNALRQARIAAVAEIPLSNAVVRTDYMVPGRDGAPDVPVRVHRPVNPSGPLPAVYWMHGGGYIIGTYAMDDQRFDAWCVRHNCVGISVDYRLAPETPYPGPLEDCYAGLIWSYREAKTLGIDPERLGIGGGSAGGGLAAALALLARDRGEVPLIFQILIYPMIDDRMTTRSSQWETPVWPPSANERGWRSYLGNLYGRDDVPYHAAPSRAADLSGLPPAFISVGAIDGFLDEDVDYAMRLLEAGVPTDLHVYPGAPHGFDGAFANVAVAKRARSHINEWLGHMLNS
jgi:acetyl esterase/lipase